MGWVKAGRGQDGPSHVAVELLGNGMTTADVALVLGVTVTAAKR